MNWSPARDIQVQGPWRSAGAGAGAGAGVGAGADGAVAAAVAATAGAHTWWESSAVSFVAVGSRRLLSCSLSVVPDLLLANLRGRGIITHSPPSWMRAATSEVLCVRFIRCSA